jgi:drug/metabolite transporter (DMT)-like permease
MEAKRPTGLIIFCYLTIYIVWGSTYFFIRQSVLTMPPFYVLAIRWTIGGVLLLGVSIARGGPKTLPSRRDVISALILGTLLLFAGNGFITAAERTIDSYIAALLVSSTPIFVAILDRFVVKKRLTALRLAAIGVGFLGVVLLLYDGRSLSTTFSPSILIGLAGVLSWCLATSLGHRLSGGNDNITSSGIQMLFVGLVSIVCGLLFEPPPREVIRQFSLYSVFGVAYLSVVGSLAFTAYIYLISHEPAERVVSYSLVNPVIALAFGLALGNETVTPYLFLGFPLIIIALILMLYGEKLNTRLRGRRGPAIRNQEKSGGSRRYQASV